MAASFGPRPVRCRATRRRRVSTLAAVVGAVLVLLAGPTQAVADDVAQWSPLTRSGVIAHAATPPIAARSWVLADLTTGSVLAAKNAHLRLRPASTLKTLTAVTLLPLLRKTEQYRVRWSDAHVQGSAVGIVPGARYSVDQLFYGMMLPSGNDAAKALASAAGGTRRTVALMTRKATMLDANDTTVRNPSGLDAVGQYTSAFDLVLFARAGLARADFRRYVTTVSTSFPAGMPNDGKRRSAYMIYNENSLLTDYRGAAGVKTGYTTLAGRTFVGAAKRQGHLLVAALMQVTEPSEDAAAKLLDWGFANLDVPPVGSLDQSGPSTAQHAPQPVGAALPTTADLAAATSRSRPVSPATAGAAAALGLSLLALGVLRSRRRRRGVLESVPYAFRR